MKVAVINDVYMIESLRDEANDYTIQANEHNVTPLVPQPAEGDFIVDGLIVKGAEVATIKDGVIIGIRNMPNTLTNLGGLEGNEVVINNLVPKPKLGWLTDGNTFEPNRKIHKAFFIDRLKPWWVDVKQARAADSDIDNDFAMFDEFTHVNFDFPLTQVMIPRLVAGVKLVNPLSTITREAIEAEVGVSEAYVIRKS